MLIAPKMETANRVIHVGGFTYEKNHTGLIRIIKPVLNDNPALQLWLVGDGPLRHQTEMLVRTEGLSAQVHFLGFREDVPDLIASSQVLILPSIIEGLPGVLLEAMASRVPVIAYDVGGVSEIVQNHKTGWLIKANDEQAFNKAILEVLGQPSSAKAIAETAFKSIALRYQNSELAKRFLKAYSELVKG